MSGNKSAVNESPSHNRRADMSGNKSADNESAVAATDCSNECAGHVKAVATEVMGKGGVGGKRSADEAHEAQNRKAQRLRIKTEEAEED